MSKRSKAHSTNKFRRNHHKLRIKVSLQSVSIVRMSVKLQVAENPQVLTQIHCLLHKVVNRILSNHLEGSSKRPIS